MKNLTYIFTLCLCALVVFSSEATEITMQPDCRTFYAGREHTLTVQTAGAKGERLNWNLRYAGRTLAGGQRIIPANGEVKITFKFPELNEGVVAETEFSCFIGKERRTSPVAKAMGDKPNIEHPTSNEFKKTLYFFYHNPFASQKEALKKLKIAVWEAGGEALSELLTELALPFVKISAPEQFSGKVLLISGLNFDSSPGTLEACLQLAQKGTKVIIMPAISGNTQLPLARLDGLKMGKNDLIRGTSGIRKKFDNENWNGKAINQASFKLIPGGETIQFSAEENAKGFTFCELRKGKGKVILTTWDIINGAKESPTPVYLLKELIGIRH